MGFLVVGESLVDLLNRDGSWLFHAAPGGSPLNVAVGLAAEGHRVRLATEVGDDLFGALLRAHLHQHGVDQSDLADAGATSLAFARVDSDGGARYDFRLGWDFAVPPSLDGVTCLHTGSLATAVPPGAAQVRELMVAARAAGVVVSYDPNVRPALMGEASVAVRQVEDLVGVAHIVKVSDEDVAWLYPGADPVAVAVGWARLGPYLVVVTGGGAGAVAVYKGQVTTCAAPRVTVADTVGAGDAFTAGLLSALARAGALGPAGAGSPPAEVEHALRYATAAATAVCAHRGAAPAGRDEIARLLAETGIVRRRPAGARD